MSGPLIALIDVGKSNTKLALIDPSAGAEVWRASRTNEVIHTPIARQLDVAAIEQWLLRKLREAPHKKRVSAIVPVAHGAAVVLVDRHGDVLAAPDYEDPRYESINATYERERDCFKRTFSPALPNGLNLGRQLVYLEERHPQLFAATGHLLLYPQYWAWRLSGVPASEVTSFGCHSDLWRPQEMSYSALARTRNWTQKFPATRFAGDVLGCISAQVASATGLDATCKVACGIHDSNASYLRFLIGRPRDEPFTVVSSGTWTVVMANRAALSGLREDRDMLANVDAFGSPVATARFMGGREYEAIASGSDEMPTADALASVVRQKAFAVPAFASGGPFAGNAGRLVDTDRLASAERTALATLYTALMTALLIESLGASGDVLVDGPLASNALFGSVLAARVPASRVLLSAGKGVGAIAYLAGFPNVAEKPLQAVSPIEPAQLDEYSRAWRELLPQTAGVTAS